MATRLYVGGLSYETTEPALQTLFSEAGEVASVNVIKDPETKRSRGFGFVEMAKEEDIEKAIKLFDGKNFEGRRLAVNEARPMKKRAFSGGNDSTWE